MAKQKKQQKRIIKRPTRSGPCTFCDKNKNPNYLEVEDLKEFLTDRSKILGVDFSGLCSKHQRRLSIAIKRARHLALLPFRAGL